MCREVVAIELRSLAFVPDHFKTEETCNKEVGRKIYTLNNVSDYIMMQKICNKVVRKNPAAFFLVPDRLKTQEMCIMTIEVGPWQLNDIPDYLNTQKMCEDVVQRDAYSSQFIFDWFVTQKQQQIWHDGHDYCDDDKLIEWYEGYQKWRAKKAKTKEELLPIAWNSDHVMDWCMPEDEKGLCKQQIICFKVIWYKNRHLPTKFDSHRA